MRKASMAASVALGVLFAVGQARADHATTQFKGAKANTGRALHSERDGKHVLTLSEDFKHPNAPAPHWQVVDSKGNVYLLQQLKIKGDRYNRSITLPSYVPDVTRVQIWCSFAESLLGEATFETPVRCSNR